MSECGFAMSNRGSKGSIRMRLWGVLHSLPRMLMCRQIILFSPLLRNTVGVRCAVV